MLDDFWQGGSLRFHWQQEGKYAPFSWRTFYRDSSAVSFDNPLDHGEPQTGVANALREESTR